MVISFSTKRKIIDALGHISGLQPFCAYIQLKKTIKGTLPEDLACFIVLEGRKQAELLAADKSSFLTIQQLFNVAFM